MEVGKILLTFLLLISWNRDLIPPLHRNCEIYSRSSVLKDNCENYKDPFSTHSHNKYMPIVNETSCIIKVNIYKRITIACPSRPAFSTKVLKF